MSDIGQVIQQDKFDTNFQKALLNTLYTSNWIRDQYLPFFKEYGILSQHYNVLRIVKGRKGKSVSPGEILKVMLDKGRDLTRLVDKLVKIGYLERQTCPENRRKVDIKITAYGITVTEAIAEKIDEWSSRNRHLTEEEAEQLSYLLDKMRG